MRAPHRTLPRRSLLAWGAALAAGTAVAGCGVDEHSPSVAGGDPPPGPPFPRTVEHRFGRTEIRSRPARVVALGRGDADVLLALGVQPVAILDLLRAGPRGVGPWARPKLAGAAPAVLTGTELDLDAIAAVAPDLVTVTRSDRVRASWERLNRLAPTIADPVTQVPEPAGIPPAGTSWQDQAVLIALAVADRRVGVDTLVDDVEAAIAAARAANPGFAGKTVSVATATDDRYYAYLAQDDRVRFLAALGFTDSPRIAGIEANMSHPPPHVTTFAREDAAALDADLTVVLGAGAELRRDRALAGIPSARAGRLLIVDDADLANAWATSTVLSVPYTLARLVPLVSEALGR